MRALYHSDKKVTCDNGIRNGIWFEKQLSKRLNKEIAVNEIGHESILLEHGDVDDDMVSVEELQSYPNPFLAHSNQGIYYEAWFNNSEEVE